MENKEVKTYVLIALFLILLYISYLIFKPFISALIASFILAYLFHSLYKKLDNYIKNSYLSSLIITSLIVLIIIIPLILSANLILREVISIAQSGNITAQISGIISKYTGIQDIQPYIEIATTKLINFIGGIASNLILNIANMFIEFLIIITAVFYLLVSGELFVDEIKKAIPFKHKDKLFKHIGDATYSIVYGFLIVGIIEFILAALFLYILKISSPFVWAFLIGLTAIIPFIGPFILLLPLMVLELIKADYYTAIALVFIGASLSVIENILRPKIIGDRTRTNPVVVFIGIAGGIKLFGFIGIIAGPLILSVVTVIIQDYYYEYTKE